jgi:hypothetical protein
MTTSRCYRHIRWIAVCPDCTAWHLAHRPGRPTTAGAQDTPPARAA